jgi:hypothetical protein
MIKNKIVLKIIGLHGIVKHMRAEFGGSGVVWLCM